MPEDDRVERKTSTVQFTYHDPGRTFDGTPYEASGKAVRQTSGVLKLLRRAVLDTAVQARNAFMQRNLDLDKEASVEEWESSPEAKMLSSFLGVIEKMQTKLSALHRATTYDPTHPPKD